MRRILTAALLAATILPATAMAQTRELARDRQDIRQERRDLGRAYARGDRDDIHEQRGDLRDARREYRDDRREYRRDWRDDRGDRRYGRNAWQDGRARDRQLHARGNWRAPFGYQSFRTGGRIAPSYYGSRYVIADPSRYRLPAARGPSRWIRHYDDVLLIDPRRGVVLDVIRNFYR